jgi:hypothetical protein
MTDLHSEPKRWHAQRNLWILILFFLAVAVIVKLSHIDESKVRQFTKAKQSRRGEIRTAREKKQKIMFKQEREGVTRHLWIQDPAGARRQFFLEATSAEVETSIIAKTKSLKESFTKPKGWLQEELFWEISSTGERVIKQGDRWVKESSPTQAVAERLYRQIVPAQRARFFDAETAEWNPDTNELVANTAFFSVLKVAGHELPSDPNAGQIIAQGTAHSISFLFDKKGRQQVSCQGVKLHLNQGIQK